MRPGAGAYGAGGEDDEGVEGFSSFLLDEKGTKNQGRHHRTHRTKRALPRHVGRGPRTQPGGGREEPVDVANACSYLLSEASRWVTGSNLVVDGGYTTR